MVGRPQVDVNKVRSVKGREMLARFVLGASVSIVAGIIAKVAGARLGGVFLAFPAILPASLTFVQHKDGTCRADRDAIGAVLGGFALIVFAATGESLFGRHNALLVLVCALAAWLVAIAVLYVLLVLVRPDDTED